MTDGGIGVRGLESGDEIRVWLRPNSPSGSVDDMENPRDWRVVSNVVWERNEQDSYYHEERAERIHTRSKTYQITFEPASATEDGSRCVMEYTFHRDGYTEYGPAKPDNPKARGEITGRIERVEKQE